MFRLRPSFEAVHEIGRQIVDDEIDAALAQLQPAHRLVGHDAKDEAGIPRRAAVGLRKGVSVTWSSGTNSASRYGPLPTG